MYHEFIIRAMKMIMKWNSVIDVDAYESYISCGEKSSCTLNDQSTTVK
jgi:hypothetical protein